MIKIEELNPKFLKFKFSWEDSYSWGCELLRKNKDKEQIVAFRIFDNYCFILVRGKIKFFAFLFDLKTESINRTKTKIFLEDEKVVICDKDAFNKFRKKSILEALEK